jgi:hypothetical protein
MTGQFIVSTGQGQLRALSHQGVFATQRYQQIVSLIQPRFSTAHVALLAEPISDPNQDTIDWYAKNEGAVRRLVDLPAERQAEIRKRFADLISEITSYAGELCASKDKHRALSGRILQMAVQYPGAESLYIVGDQPVIVCWGYASEGQHTKPEHLVRGGERRDAPDVYDSIYRSGRQPGEFDQAPEDVIRSRARAPRVEPAPPPEVVPTAPRTPEVKRQRFRWRWSWLLGLLALLALISLLFRCSGPFSIPGFGPGCSLNGRDTGPGCSGPSGQTSAIGEALAREQDRETALRQEADRLKATLAERMAACPSSSGPDKGRQLVIPREATKTGKVDFLKGCWLCETGLADSKTNEDLSVKFCFDDKGSGEQLVVLKKGTCTGAVHARMADEQLIIDADQARCSQSGSYSALRIECRQQGNDQALCEGSYSPEHKWAAKFKRIAQ